MRRNEDLKLVSKRYVTVSAGRLSQTDELNTTINPNQMSF